MKTNRLLRTFCCIAALTATSAWATVVTWQLNPNNTNGNVGSSSLDLTQSGFTITARGYDNVAANPDTLHSLFFKSGPTSGGASERGLGLVGTLDNELQTSGGMPSNYIQLDLRSILGQGFGSFQVSIGSIQSGESFLLFGSNTQGSLGTQIGSGGSTFDDQFISVTNAYQFISIAAGAMDVLPVAFRATVTPVPEMSALFPVFGLIAAVSFTQILRRRRAAQKTASIV